MKFKEYKYLILSDLYRIKGNINLKILLKELLLGESYKYIFWMRTSKYLRQRKIFKYTLYIISRFMLNKYKYKFGIDIPVNVEIKDGFTIHHFGGIIINSSTKIGKCCNISQNVTLGEIKRGNAKGNPTIKDNVFIGPGAKILGNIIIGNNVAIGANCVVTKDIPDNSVVVGIPARIISQEGSIGYVNRTDYNKFFQNKDS
jgi:serine O-acetyltransferase